MRADLISSGWSVIAIFQGDSTESICADIMFATVISDGEIIIG